MYAHTSGGKWWWGIGCFAAHLCLFFFYIEYVVFPCTYACTYAHKGPAAAASLCALVVVVVIVVVVTGNSNVGEQKNTQLSHPSFSYTKSIIWGGARAGVMGQRGQRKKWIRCLKQGGVCVLYFFGLSFSFFVRRNLYFAFSCCWLLPGPARTCRLCRAGTLDMGH